MQAVEQGLYQGGDGSNFAYVVLSAVAPKHLNIVRVKFGFKVADCLATLYRLVDGQLYNETTREWRALVDGLIPGTSYNFIAYTEQARSRLSTNNNPTLTMTTQGDTMVNITQLASRLAVHFISASEDIGFHNETYTISGGIITLSGDYRLRAIRVLPETGNADQLDQITGGRLGDVIILYANPGDTITVADGIYIALGANFGIVGNNFDTLTLMSNETSTFYQIAKGDN